MSVQVYIGLGSNLGDSIGILQAALRDLSSIPATRVVRSSSFYRNPPLGPQDQGPYTNAVAEVESHLGPLRMLRWLLRVEQWHGRVRGRRWGPRTLDLDLLLYGMLRMNTRELVLPHPGVHCRDFVVHPLSELSPGLSIPGRGSLGYWRMRVSSRNLRQLPIVTERGLALSRAASFQR
jgi:2-amino-4-hydroxy-6-hydroxymethyldihydropteridine diphosphokinase